MRVYRVDTQAFEQYDYMSLLMFYLYMYKYELNFKCSKIIIYTYVYIVNICIIGKKGIYVLFIIYSYYLIEENVIYIEMVRIQT